MKNDHKLREEESPDIAIIGMAGRFPGAKNIDEYWENLRFGVESISFFSDEELIESGTDPDLLRDPRFVKAAPILEDAALFDASFFGYTPRESQFIDPQQRLFLECAWEALEHAGCDARRFDGPIGVYGAAAMNTYLLFSGLLPHFIDEYLLTLTGSDKDFLATRVSYKLNLTGPSITVQTACSSSLVAVHLACQSLLNSECDIALAGGVSVRVPQKSGYLYQEGSIFTPDGHCRPFDASAKGTIFGSGVGIVVLKRLADAIADGDCVHAVIKGTAINNDGSSKANYTAPSIDRQSEGIAEAIAHSGIDAETISYVETHGTGTILGDPIEIAALTKAFRAFTQSNGFCAIGSVKSNIGHMDAGAGVAGLIKTVLALKNEMIPPSLHFEHPNPEIDFKNSPFYVNSKLSEWKRSTRPRRAGINALGVGGTNAHIIIEEAPMVEASGHSRAHHLLLLSSKTSMSLDMATQNMAEYLKKNPQTNLADLTYTLQVGRKCFDHRRMIVSHSCDDARAALSTLDSGRVFTSRVNHIDRDVVFLFSGQGTQYVNMGRELFETEAEFRHCINRCAEILGPHLSINLSDILYPREEDADQAAILLGQTRITQPALFAIEFALARLWLSWGLHPVAMVGHSIGEYVAACMAEVFSLEDALSTVAVRGKLMQELPGGFMLAVPLSEDEVHPYLNEKLSLAAVNGPSLCIVSGEAEAVKRLEVEFRGQGLNCRYLQTSHAFHSSMVEPIIKDFVEQVKQVDLNYPKVPFISNVTGTWIKPDQATDPFYWAAHLRQTVRFADAMLELAKEPDRVLLEIGPDQTLCKLAKQNLGRGNRQMVLPSCRGRDSKLSDPESLLDTLGKLWLSGVEIDWFAFNSQGRRHKIPLPTYPFQRERHWIGTSAVSDKQMAKLPIDNGHRQAASPAAGLVRDEEESGAFDTRLVATVMPRTPVEGAVARIWNEVLGIERIGIYEDFFALGGHSMLIPSIISRLNQIFHVELPLISLLESPTIADLALCIEAIYQIEQGVMSMRPT